MDSKKLPELKQIKRVNVRVSKNGKWLTHILPEQGIMVTFSMNYYRSILKSHPEEGAESEVKPESSNG